MNLWQSPGKLYCLKKNAPGQLFLWEKQVSRYSSVPCGSPWLGLFCGGVPFGPLALAPLPAASAQYEAHKLQLHTAPGLKQEESLAGCRWHAPGTRLQYAPTAKKTNTNYDGCAP